MEKSKLLPVIAAIMITSMAVSMLSFSTTTVKASVSPLSVTVRTNTRVKLTFTITNDTGENIENVRFTIYGTPTPYFSAAIGGALTAENLKLAAENLENARIDLNLAGENLLLAAENKKRAGVLIENAATYLSESAAGLIGAALDNVKINMSSAATYLRQVGDNMALYTENITAEAASLVTAYNRLDWAAGTAGGENLWGYNVLAAENLDNAASLLNSAATALQGGSIRRAAENLVIAGSYMENAGGWLDDNTGQEAAGQKLTLAGTSLRNAGLSLRQAGVYENLAGVALVSAAAQLDSTGEFIEAADTTDLAAAGDNLENAAVGIDNAGDALSAVIDNIPAAGDNLVWAAARMASSAASLGADLGGDYENAASVNIDYAGDNLKTAGQVNLKVAGEQLIAAATNLASMKATLEAAADSIGPAGWSIASDAANDVQFNAIDNQGNSPENQISSVAGSSKDFVFLWSTPNVGAIDNVYTLKIYVYKPGSSIPTGTYSVTLTVSGIAPGVTITVTQTGVTVNNVVGNTLGDGVATVTIVSSGNKVISLGSVYVENTDQENRLPPLSISTDDNITFTATFSVGIWDDNAMQIRVASAKNVQGNENTNMTQTFTVDTRAPIIIENGFAGLVTGMRGNVAQPGTTTVYRYVDNTGSSKQIYGRAEDNENDADNDLWCTVYINDVLASKDAAENFFKTITLSQGLNTVIVKAVDRAGNEASENIDNIFIDTQPPTITFNTITKTTGAVSWTDNDFLINDNTPEINLTIFDPGYPDSGLGVAYDNLNVYLNNSDNIDNIALAAPYGPLDNKSPWDVSTGVFENVIDNAGKGLVNGTYWIIVSANDNLAHDVLDNDNWVIAKRSFTIDVSVPTWTTAQLNDPVTGVKVKDSATNAPLGPTTKKTSWSISGGARKPGSTINVYVAASAPVLKGTVTASPTPNSTTTLYDYSLTIELSEGANQSVFIEEISTASNSSGLVLFGTYTVDATPPVIVLSAPADDTTTDAAQITVSGTITDAIVTDPQTLIVTIDCTGASVAKAVYLNASGSFETTVPLTEGINKINVVAADGDVTATSGNQAITTSTVTRTVTPLTTYAIILVVVALILAAIAIFRKEMK